MRVHCRTELLRNVMDTLKSVVVNFCDDSNVIRGTPEDSDMMHRKVTKCLKTWEKHVNLSSQDFPPVFLRCS
jgi:hypothetical protein